MTARLAHGRVVEPEGEIPLRSQYDVVVAGGGLGGIAAAVASARAGARTLLVERNAFVGGTATAGMCCSIFNCYFTRLGQPGTTGIAVEVADRLAEAEGYGARWRRHKGHIIYDVEKAKVALQDLVDQAGAETLLATPVIDAVMEGSAIRGIVAHTKKGREAILARVVVDASGDADVAAASGAPTRTIEAGKHSLCFRLGGVDVDAFVAFFREHPDQYPAPMDVEWTVEEALAQYDDCGTFLFPHGGGIQLDALKQAKADGALPASVGLHNTTDACQMHCLRRTGIAHVITGFVQFDGLEAGAITRGVIDGRRMAFAVADAFRRYVRGFADAFVAGTAENLGVRVSRCLDGEFVFTAEMMEAGVRFPDAIGRAVGSDHPIRHRGAGAWSCQALRADSFDVPYRCIVPRNVDGLLMGAGRSVSAANPRLLRVMVHTMVVGQGAGAAAAVSARSGTPPRLVDIGLVQAELRRQGVQL
ncbi:MAG: FAD-dependent oxidoreductase [Candidatus Sumerlaeota bacterium]|nr:FAD-dependent oxidoreductase [Candidatus Sumerlaeota bacterium]